MRFLVSLLFIFFAFQTAFPCSCMKLEPEPEPSALLKDIDVIFQGRVVFIGPHVAQTLKSSKGKNYPGPTTYEVEFEVLKKWKGAATERIKIQTETLSCHTKFELDKEYFVLATGAKLFEVHFCTSKYIELADVEKEYGAREIIEKSRTPVNDAEKETLWARIRRQIASFFS